MSETIVPSRRATRSAGASCGPSRPNTATAGASCGRSASRCSVTRDGAPNPTPSRDIENGVDIRIGSADVFSSTGPHTYVLTCRTDRQIGFYDGHDEIYWNVTGNDWQFVIEQASATIRLPPKAAATKLAAFTGAYGAAGTDAVIAETRPASSEAHHGAARRPRRASPSPPPSPRASSRRPPGGGRGCIFSPTIRASRRRFSASARSSSMSAACGRRDGPDPRPASWCRCSTRRNGLSPADARYLDRFAFDDEGFAATLLNLAALGFVTVEARGGGDGDPAYTIARRGEAETCALPAPERAACRILFGKGRKNSPSSPRTANDARRLCGGPKASSPRATTPEHVGDRADLSLAASASSCSRACDPHSDVRLDELARRRRALRRHDGLWLRCFSASAAAPRPRGRRCAIGSKA